MESKGLGHTGEEGLLPMTVHLAIVVPLLLLDLNLEVPLLISCLDKPMEFNLKRGFCFVFDIP